MTVLHYEQPFVCSIVCSISFQIIIFERNNHVLSTSFKMISFHYSVKRFDVFSPERTKSVKIILFYK